MIAHILRRFALLPLIGCAGLLLCNGCSSQKGVAIKGEAGNVKDAKVEINRPTYPVPEDVKRKLESQGKK